MPIALAIMPVVMPGHSHDNAPCPPREHGRIRRLQPRPECGSAATLSANRGGTGVGHSVAWVYLGLAHGANDATRQTLDPVLRFAGRRLGHQLHDLVGFRDRGTSEPTRPTDRP